MIRENLEEKKKLPQVRETTFLTGKLKNLFLDDCIDQEESEATVLRQIIREHYERRNKF